jgi:hypothetical protein
VIGFGYSGRWWSSVSIARQTSGESCTQCGSCGSQNATVAYAESLSSPEKLVQSSTLQHATATVFGRPMSFVSE